MKAQNYDTVIGEYGFEQHPIIELEDITDTEKHRTCNICHARCKNVKKFDLRLGCNKQTVSTCICENCLMVLDDMLGEAIELLSQDKPIN